MVEVQLANYKFTPEMTKAFEGDVKFVPATYQKDYAIVRELVEASEPSLARLRGDRAALWRAFDAAGAGRAPGAHPGTRARRGAPGGRTRHR